MIAINIGGVTYQVPEKNEESWGTQVTNIIVALAQQTLTKDKTSFVLTGGTLSFGTAHGISVKELLSNAANPSTTGFIKLNSGESVGWRNSGNSADLLLGLSSNKLNFNSIDLVDISSVQSLSNKTYAGTASSLSIDADNNSISNIELDNLKPGVLDVNLVDGTSGTDNTIPSAKATKDYIDATVLAERSASITLTNKTLEGAIINNSTLSGTTTIVDSTDLRVTDKKITVNHNGSNASSEGAGIEVERVGTDGSLEYEDALASKFKCGALGSEAEIVTVSATQTLTNKTLTGAQLNEPNINLDGMTLSNLTAPSANLQSPAFSGTPTGSLTDLQVIETVNTVTPATLDAYTSAVDATDLANWSLDGLENNEGIFKFPSVAITLDTSSEITGPNSYHILSTAADNSADQVYVELPSISITIPGTYTYSIAAKYGSTHTAMGSNQVIVFRDNNINNFVVNAGTLNSITTTAGTFTFSITFSQTGNYNIVNIFPANAVGQIVDCFIDDISLTADFQAATIDFDKPVNKVEGITGNIALIPSNQSTGKSTKILLETSDFNTNYWVSDMLDGNPVGQIIGGFYTGYDRPQFDVYYDGTSLYYTGTLDRRFGRTETTVVSGSSNLIGINSLTEIVELAYTGSSTTPSFTFTFTEGSPGTAPRDKLLTVIFYNSGGNTLTSFTMNGPAVTGTASLAASKNALISVLTLAPSVTVSHGVAIN